MRLAAEPIVSIGRVRAMTRRIAPVAMMATRGVRRLGSILATGSGSHASRAIEKATREAAITVAFKADIVESSPPKTMIATPNAGMKSSAARTIAVSLYLPRNCQLGVSPASTAPSETNRISRYIVIVIASAMNVARGMFFSGSLISSATVAMRS